MPLDEYSAKRDFARTPEPGGAGAASAAHAFPPDPTYARAGVKAACVQCHTTRQRAREDTHRIALDPAAPASSRRSAGRRTIRGTPRRHDRAAAIASRRRSNLPVAVRGNAGTSCNEQGR